MKIETGTIVDASRLEHRPDGQIRCPSCGKWARLLFRVSSGPAVPVCQPCASAAIKSQKPGPEAA